MSFMRTVLVLATVIAASPAVARTPVPLQEFRDQPILTVSGRAPALEQIRQATVKAAIAAGWSLARVAEDAYEGTKVVRGKHTVVVVVAIGPDRYSVTYRASDNMKYRVGRDGVPLIHPNYNVWARQLVDAIRLETSAL